MAFINCFVVIVVLLPGVVAEVPVVISPVNVRTVGSTAIITVVGVVVTIGATSGG